MLDGLYHRIRGVFLGWYGSIGMVYESCTTLVNLKPNMGLVVQACRLFDILGQRPDGFRVDVSRIPSQISSINWYILLSGYGATITTCG